MISTVYILTAILAAYAAAAPTEEVNAVDETVQLVNSLARDGWCADRNNRKLNRSVTRKCCSQVKGKNSIVSGKCGLAKVSQQAAFTGCCRTNGKLTIGL